MKAGSLFSGIGGFDIALEKAGFEISWQSEVDKQCIKLLESKWPNVKRYGDIREFLEWDVEPADIIVGGDPCPCRSRARVGRKSTHPDLSGYFLAVVGRFKPKWVVRENVPAPDVIHFTSALEAFGYGAIVIKTNAAGFTGQSRTRDFIVAEFESNRMRIASRFIEFNRCQRMYSARIQEKQVIPCLVTRAYHYDSRDCYIWEPSRGLRILDSEEREAFAGFPTGWTAGFSKTARARMCGNAVVPAVAYEILKRIANNEKE